MNRLPYLSLALSALLLLAGCAGSLSGDTSSGVPTTTSLVTDGGVAPVDGPVISVTGTGQVSTDADLAVVSVSVTATADTADDARSQVASDVERMRAALVDAGVDEDAVTTARFAVVPEYDYTERERELVGYRAVHSFRIEIAPDEAGSVVDTAVGNGADTVDSVAFTLTDETRADLRSQALTAAVETARADADTLASAAGLSVDTVHTMSTSGGVSPRIEADTSESLRAGDGAATAFAPGPVTVTATVHITYTAN